MSLYVHAGSDTSGRWDAPQTPPDQTQTTVQNTWCRAPSPSHSLQTVFFAWAQSYWKCHWQVLSVKGKERNSPNHTHERKLKWFHEFFRGGRKQQEESTLVHSQPRPCTPSGAVSRSAATASCNPSRTRRQLQPELHMGAPVQGNLEGQVNINTILFTSCTQENAFGFLIYSYWILQRTNRKLELYSGFCLVVLVCVCVVIFSPL